MIEQFQFYCVYCERIVEGNNKSPIFKTGFYRYDIKMGCCEECAVNQYVLCTNNHNVEKNF